MRYRFIDEIGLLATDPPRIEVAKTFAADDALSGPGGPDVVPPSLVLELLATTGGQLLFRHLGRDRLPLLLKVEDLRFDTSVRPGVRLTSSAVVRGQAPAAQDVMAQTSAQVADEGGAVIASGRFFYLCVKLPDGVEPGDLVPVLASEVSA